VSRFIPVTCFGAVARQFFARFVNPLLLRDDSYRQCWGSSWDRLGW